MFKSLGKQKDNKIITPRELKKEDKKIGEGSFGIVYSGTFRGNKVAIKEIKGVIDKDTTKEFLKEVAMLDKFRSEYIIHFYGAVSERKNTLCVVTEFAQFGSLQDLINNRKEDSISMKIRIKIMIDSAKGIQYLHSNGISHRDIKPSNILVVSLDDNVPVNAKLSDFGSSKNTNLIRASTKLTATVGTFVYMSPEVLNQEYYGPPSDVFSFAIAMFECFGWCECYPNDEFKSPLCITEFVTKGKRRQKQSNMTDRQYQLIDNCWKQNQTERIIMEDVVKKKLEEMIEIQQIEVWIGLGLGNVIFDLDVDDWNVNTSVFDQRIINKSNLIFN